MVIGPLKLLIVWANVPVSGVIGCFNGTLNGATLRFKKVTITGGNLWGISGDLLHQIRTINLIRIFLVNLTG
jgi:hypothetical protein